MNLAEIFFFQILEEKKENLELCNPILPDLIERVNVTLDPRRYLVDI